MCYGEVKERVVLGIMVRFVDSLDKVETDLEFIKELHELLDWFQSEYSKELLEIENRQRLEDISLCQQNVEE